MGLDFSEEVDGSEGGGTSYKCLSATVVDVTSVEGLGSSVVAVREAIPVSVVVEVFTDGDSLGSFEGQDLLENRPSDSFSARRGSQRSFVSPVGALGHRLEELRDLHVSDGPGLSSL